MFRTSDLTPALATPARPDLGFHQGIVVSWNNQTGENLIDMSGTALENLPMLNIAESITVQPGYVVGILRFKKTYFILGRILSPGIPDFGSGTSPSNSFTFWQNVIDAALLNSTVDSLFHSRFAGGFVINHPRVRFEAGFVPSGIGTAGNWRVAWYTAQPPNTANPPGSTQMFASPVGTVSATHSGFYTWPPGMLGQLVYVSFESRMTAGIPITNNVAVMPHYFYGLT